MRKYRGLAGTKVSEEGGGGGLPAASGEAHGRVSCSPWDTILEQIPVQQPMAEQVDVA